jgi:hypothetical protein
MFASLLPIILEIGLKAFGWFLDKSKADKQTKEAFYEFVKKAGNDFGSTKLMHYGDEQLAELKSKPWQETK